jgi:YbbR domain-containing protein
MKRILHNWHLKLISLFLAMMLWLFVVQINDPSDSTTFYEIPVTITNQDLLEKENKVFSVDGDTDIVRVSVKAPRSVIQKLRASDIVAEADMSRLTELNTIPIDVRVLDQNVDSVSVSPNAMRLRVEQRASKWIRVQYGLVGQVKEGYIVSKALPDQTMIEVSGPVSQIDQISYAYIELNIDGASTNLAANLEATLCNSEDEPLQLENVKQNVQHIHMDVEILAIKEVPVVYEIMGEPAEGYLLTGKSEISNPTITIAATETVLETVRQVSIPAEKIDVTDCKENLVSYVYLKDFLPETVKIPDIAYNGSVTVTVYIEKEFEKSFSVPADQIAIANIPAGLEVDMPEEIPVYELEVKGLKNIVNALPEKNLGGSIDMKAWMEQKQLSKLTVGTPYVVPVKFTFGKDVTIVKGIEMQLKFKKAEG